MAYIGAKVKPTKGQCNRSEFLQKRLREKSVAYHRLIFRFTNIESNVNHINFRKRKYCCLIMHSNVSSLFVFLGNGKNVMTSYGYGYKQNSVIG